MDSNYPVLPCYPNVYPNINNRPLRGLIKISGVDSDDDVSTFSLDCRLSADDLMGYWFDLNLYTGQRWGSMYICQSPGDPTSGDGMFYLRSPSPGPCGGIDTFMILNQLWALGPNQTQSGAQGQLMTNVGKMQPGFIFWDDLQALIPGRHERSEFPQ